MRKEGVDFNNGHLASKMLPRNANSAATARKDRVEDVTAYFNHETCVKLFH